MKRESFQSNRQPLTTLARETRSVVVESKPRPSIDAISVSSNKHVDRKTILNQQRLVRRSSRMAEIRKIQTLNYTRANQSVHKDPIIVAKPTITISKPAPQQNSELRVIGTEFQNIKDLNSNTPKQKNSLKNILKLASTGVLVFGFLISLIIVTNNRKIVVDKPLEEQTVSAKKEDSQQDQTEIEPTPEDFNSHQVAASQARYIRIPDASVQAIVKPVALTNNGNLAVPTNIFTVGWYKDSSLPMDAGGAVVMTGHYSGRTRAQGVFGKIENLNVGDSIEIETGAGAKRSFSVVEKQKYPYNEVDMNKAVVSPDTSKLGLTLITCGGTFKDNINTYDQRTMIRAVAIN